MNIDEINIKAFGLSGAIQTAKEIIGVYADGSRTFEADMAFQIWSLLNSHQQILRREFPSLPEPTSGKD
jgi:hypothetical protein